MRRPAFCASLVIALASMPSAQAPARAPAQVAAPAPVPSPRGARVAQPSPPPAFQNTVGATLRNPKRASANLVATPRSPRTGRTGSRSSKCSNGTDAAARLPTRCRRIKRAGPSRESAAR
jgi:hypothetical protein